MSAYARFGQQRFDSAADANGCWNNIDEALCMKTVGQDILIAQAADLSAAQTLIAAQGA